MGEVTRPVELPPIYHKEMLFQLHKSYFIVAFLLYAFFLFTSSGYSVPLYLFNVIMFIAYFCVLNNLLVRGEKFFSKKNLLILIAFFSLLVVISYKFISYLYNDNFFVFSESDALAYYKYAQRMSKMHFMEGISYYLKNYSIDDLGGALIPSLLYRLVDSILVLNFFYIICGLITALALYRISSHFMSVKYAFICATAYSLSSFVLWFQASGLKESFMCMLVVLFYHGYYLFIKKRAFIQLAYPSICLIGLLLFRPALIFFCVASVSMGLILQKRKGNTGILIMVFVFALLIILSAFIESSYKHFTAGGNFNRLIAAREADGMIKGGLKFTYMVNILAQILGPLPTISPGKNLLLSFYSSGLLYKALLSVVFWIGIYYIFSFKVELLYPLIFFALFEMISLLSILEGLELRKSLPHFPMIYIIAFWFLDKFDAIGPSIAIRNKKNLRSIFSLSSFVVFFLILVWNTR